MYVMTHTMEMVAYDEENGLHRTTDIDNNSHKLIDITIDCDNIITSGPMIGFRVLALGFDIANQPAGIYFIRDGAYLTSSPHNVSLEHDRIKPGEWENFSLVTIDQFRNTCNLVQSKLSEINRFSEVVLELNKNETPVKVYCGAGKVPRPGFLNIDIECFAPLFRQDNPKEYFLFPFANERWNIPDESVDYIFHEDFIEHVPQIMQWQFLAETFRVLKTGCWHRVNTPHLIASMKLNSAFKSGFDGVYTGELRWGHVAILTPTLLREMAETIGYREVVFTTKSHGVSPFAVEDLRPCDDRDDITGNIYADLLK